MIKIMERLRVAKYRYFDYLNAFIDDEENETKEIAVSL